MSPEQVATQRDIADYGTKVNFWQWSPRREKYTGDLERGEGGEVERFRRLARSERGAGCKNLLTALTAHPHRLAHRPCPPSSSSAPSPSASATFVAVDDLSLAIAPGEFLTLLGASGSGKTTTLRMIAGFEHPTAGEILMDGPPITALPPYRRDLNTVFQQYALFPHMTVRENVGYGLRMRNVPQAERTERVRQALDMVQLAPLARAGAAPALRRPAAARRPGPRAGQPAPGAAARRAARRARPQAPQGDAARAEAPQPAARHHRSSTSRTTRKRRSRCPTGSR